MMMDVDDVGWPGTILVPEGEQHRVPMMSSSATATERRPGCLGRLCPVVLETSRSDATTIQSEPEEAARSRPARVELGHELGVS
jgi:hypothetical protein